METKHCALPSNASIVSSSGLNSPSRATVLRICCLATLFSTSSSEVVVMFCFFLWVPTFSSSNINSYLLCRYTTKLAVCCCWLLFFYVDFNNWKRCRTVTTTDVERQYQHRLFIFLGFPFDVFVYRKFSHCTLICFSVLFATFNYGENL